MNPLGICLTTSFSRLLPARIVFRVIVRIRRAVVSNGVSRPAVMLPLPTPRATSSACYALAASVAVTTASAVVGFIGLPITMVSSFAAVAFVPIIRDFLLRNLGSKLFASLEVDPSQGSGADEKDNMRSCSHSSADEQHCQVHAWRSFRRDEVMVQVQDTRSFALDLEFGLGQADIGLQG